MKLKNLWVVERQFPGSNVWYPLLLDINRTREHAREQKRVLSQVWTDIRYRITKFTRTDARA